MLRSGRGRGPDAAQFVQLVQVGSFSEFINFRAIYVLMYLLYTNKNVW